MFFSDVYEVEDDEGYITAKEGDEPDVSDTSVSKPPECLKCSADQDASSTSWPTAGQHFTRDKDDVTEYHHGDFQLIENYTTHY